MEDIKLEKGKSYLVKMAYGIQKIKVLDVTEKCYQIQFENGEPIWKFKSDFERIGYSSPEIEIIEYLKSSPL